MKRLDLINAYLMSTSGALIYLIAPVLIGTAMDSLALDSEKAGLLLAAYFLGYTLITTSAVFWLRHVNMRSAAWASNGVFIAALLISATQGSLTLIYSGLFFAGVGAGMLYGISITIMDKASHPISILVWRWPLSSCWAALYYLQGQLS